MHEVGIGTRILNVLVDSILVFIISYGLYKWHTFYVLHWSFTFIPFYVFFHVTTVFYYLLFEWALGRTPGKFVSLTRVVDLQNKKPGFIKVILRSVFRIGYISAFFLLVFKRPLHDWISKTRVVEV